MKVALWAEIRRLAEMDKLSGRLIARRLHCSRHTVAAALKLQQPPTPRAARRASVLDPYLDRIKELLARYPDLSAVRIREEIAQACLRAGRAESDVALMAVSKMHPAEAIAEAWTAGLRLFGENRVQEWQEKSVAVGQLEGAAFHLIGPLQSNKAARAAELFDAIDSVDSLKIAVRLNAAALALG